MDAGVKTKKPGGQLERGRKGEASAQTTIKSVGIIGAGQMGNGIAHVVALAGYEVFLNDAKKEAVDKARSTIERNMARQVSRGIITDAEMQGALKRIRVASDLRTSARPTSSSRRPSRTRRSSARSSSTFVPSSRRTPSSPPTPPPSRSPAWPPSPTVPSASSASIS